MPLLAVLRPSRLGAAARSARRAPDLGRPEGRTHSLRPYRKSVDTSDHVLICGFISMRTSIGGRTANEREPAQITLLETKLRMMWSVVGVLNELIDGGTSAP